MVDDLPRWALCSGKLVSPPIGACALIKMAYSLTWISLVSLSLGASLGIPAIHRNSIGLLLLATLIPYSLTVQKFQVLSQGMEPTFAAGLQRLYNN
jgi:hypothetical protein